jgi:nucleotide-binding universal stress UspA family protein
LAGVKFAVRFAQEVGARIIVLHVTDLGPVMMTTACGNYDSTTYTEAARRRCGKQMRAFLKRVDFDGVPVHTSAVAGYCPTAIHEAVAKERADLIIISTHGRIGFRRAFWQCCEGIVDLPTARGSRAVICGYAQKVRQKGRTGRETLQQSR